MRFVRHKKPIFWPKIQKNTHSRHFNDLAVFTQFLLPTQTITSTRQTQQISLSVPDLCTSAHAEVLPGSHGTTESLDTAAKGKKARRRKGQKQGQATADAGDAADAAPSLQAPLERDEELADQGQQAEAKEDDFKEDDLRQTVGLPVGASAADPAATSSSLQQRKHAKRRKKPRSRDNEQQTVACERGSRWSELARIICLCALMACSGLWIYFQPQALRPFFQFASSWSSFSGRS